MSDSRNENSDYVRFVLQYESENSLVLDKSPEGWDEDALEIVRNTKYHGITTQFTNGLKFIKDAKDFINDAYSKGGLNGNMYLIKYTLRKNAVYDTSSFSSDSVPDIAWEERYRGLADFKTKKEKDGKVELNFNSDELEDIIKSHESDDFELDRKESIGYTGLNFDGDLSAFNQQNMLIKGRNISASGEARGVAMPSGTPESGSADKDSFILTIPTEFVTKGFDRHVEVTSPTWDINNPLSLQENFIYNDSEIQILSNAILRFEIDIKATVRLLSPPQGTNIPKVKLGLFHASFINLQGGFYSYQGHPDAPIASFTLDDNFPYNTEGEYIGTIDIPSPGFSDETNYLTGWYIGFQFTETNGIGLFTPGWQFSTYNIKITETTVYNSMNETYKFSHLNDIGSRLLEIMTGKSHKFYSKFLGRDKSNFPSPSTGVSPLYQDYDYVETGEAGDVAVIHGLALRRFEDVNKLYKSITTSFKNYVKVLQSTFNVGLGVESSKYGQRVRIEKLEYFYRDDIAVKLPYQVSNTSRQTEPKMFLSSATLGADKGGEYELGIGLDEPNIKTKYVLPLQKTDNKYEKTSKYRSDDIGMEQLRRRPYWLNETEDRTGDEHIWLLDLTGIDLESDGVFHQLDWQDVLASQPTGILNPDSYRSWRFTPKRCLMRHEWVLRAGMEHNVYMNNKVSIASTNANVNLSTQYAEESVPVAESEPIIVRNMERPRLLPEIIKFTHPIDDDLYDLILGKTTVRIGGEDEQVPNWYFKFQWINEEGEFETGYLKSFKPKKNEFEFYKANEKLIFN